MDGSAGEQLNLPPFAPFSSLWGVSRSQTKHARHHHHHCHSHYYVLQTPQHIFNGQKKEQELEEHEEEDRKTDNPSEQPCRTRVMTLQTAHCRDLLFIPRCFCSCANRMSLDFCRVEQQVLNVNCCCCYAKQSNDDSTKTRLLLKRPYSQAVFKHFWC